MNYIYTQNAPEAIGPYSQAIKVGNMVYMSGQIAILAGSMKISGEDIESQTKQVLKNLNEILIASGTNKSKVVKVTIYMKNIEDFGKVNLIYEKFFEGHKPARSTVEVSRLPKDVLIEMDMIAIINDE